VVSSQDCPFLKSVVRMVLFLMRHNAAVSRLVGAPASPWLIAMLAGFLFLLFLILLIDKL
jgi:hypothetical protein